ncbi:manganese catalase family protein [Dehalobacter sp. DCM]|uniref:ferritin-like domain-containing protein n=1 Tax=Dehalobacter sp. DCM TaxID=2907827 RepID=UPI003081A9FE|nr:manganese catalase family protein [Dehalobacter sp. DCM]
MSENNFKKHRREGYADPSPYPAIAVQQSNIYYAELLIDDYAGMVSEFTAISQYLYHHYFFREVDEALGELLDNIAITEMLHMEILAELIRKLGGNPVIRGGSSTAGTFWSGSFVCYGHQLCDQLQADIQSEQKAIAAYREHIRIIADPNIKAILQRIILDEEVHIRLFNKALAKYCKA